MNLKLFDSNHKKLEPMHDRFENIKALVLEIDTLSSALSSLVNTIWEIEMQLINSTEGKF